MGIFVTNSGFSIRSLQTILASFNAAMRSFFGPTVDTSPEGPTGQLLGIEAAGLSDVWQAAQEVYASMDPAQATGAALDRICAYTGVARIAAAETTVNALLYTDAANAGVSIPAGSQARRVRGAVVFSLSTNTVITPGFCQDIYLCLTNPPDSGSTVALTTSFGAFSVVTPTLADPNARTLQTLLLLASSIEASAWGVGGVGVLPGVVQVWVNGNLSTPLVDTIGGAQYTTGYVLRLAHTENSFSLGFTGGVNASWTMKAVGSSGQFLCSATGAQTVAVNELTSIVSPQTGWNSVTNLVVGIPGRDAETDTELRIRREKQLGLGLGTQAAMTAYILNNVAGVTGVTVVSNDADSTDSFGALPHTVTVTVVGGDPQEIADAIWACKPVGIGTTGNTHQPSVDSQGTIHVVNFNNPVSMPVYVKVLYDIYAEEQFPLDGQAQMAEALVAWSLTEYTPGKDVIAPRMAAPLYTVPGIGNLQVTVSLAGPSGPFVAGPVTMDPGQIAALSIPNIQFGVL